MSATKYTIQGHNTKHYTETVGERSMQTYDTLVTEILLVFNSSMPNIHEGLTWQVYHNNPG